MNTIAAIGVTLIAACLVAISRIGRRTHDRSPHPAPHAPTAAPQRAAQPVRTGMLVREPSENQPDGVKGTLVVCDSARGAERVATALLNRFGSGVEEAQTLESALAALQEGANAAVCVDGPGCRTLPTAEWWPPTIVLGSAAVQTDLVRTPDPDPTTKVEPNSDLECALCYFEALRLPPPRPKRQTARDIVRAILRATGQDNGVEEHATTRSASPKTTLFTAPGRRRLPAAATGRGSLPVGLVFIPTLAATVVVWFNVANHVSTPPKIPTTGHPAAFEWDQRIFWGKQQFAAWLKRHGVSFDAWATNHPDAAKTLEHPVNR